VSLRGDAKREKERGGIAAAPHRLPWSNR